MNFNAKKVLAAEQLKPYSKTPRLALLISLIVSYILAIIFTVFIPIRFSPFSKILPKIYSTNLFTNFKFSTTFQPFQFLDILITGLITPVFSMAYFALIVQIAKQKKTDQYYNFTLKDYFANFKLAGKGIGNYWWTILWVSIWGLLFLIPLISIEGFVFYILIEKKLIDPKIASKIINISGLICFYSVYIFKWLAYCLNTYAIADNNDLKIREAMNVSKAITKGYRAEVFKFYLSFIGQYLLIVFTLGIASIWLQPHINMSVYNLYKELLENYKPAE